MLTISFVPKIECLGSVKAEIWPFYFWFNSMVKVEEQLETKVEENRQNTEYGNGL